MLISRYGKVVAVIEPASLSLDQGVLAAHAAPGLPAMPELTATEIGQDGPAERIRAAEAGAVTLVTKNQKVYGVMRPPSVEPEAALTDPDLAERMLARFEHDHPQATAAELADESERLHEALSAEAALRPYLGSPVVESGPVPTEPRAADLRSADALAWAEAMTIQGLAHEPSGDLAAARTVYDTAIERLRGVGDERLRSRMHVMMLKAAQFHYLTGDSPTALRLAETVSEELDSFDRVDAARPARPVTPPTKLGRA